MSKEAEAQAILFALKKVREFQLDNILFFTDSLEIVCTIEGNKDRILMSVVVDMLVLVKRFAFIKFRHFFRVLNVAAHFLAKFCFKSNVGIEFSDSFSNWFVG